jgi:hypothetical protein
VPKAVPYPFPTAADFMDPLALGPRRQPRGSHTDRYRERACWPQVLGADDGWQDVVLRHNQVAVMAGYTLGYATAGRVRVCRHRVVGVALLAGLLLLGCCSAPGAAAGAPRCGWMRFWRGGTRGCLRIAVSTVHILHIRDGSNHMLLSPHCRSTPACPPAHAPAWPTSCAPAPRPWWTRRSCCRCSGCSWTAGGRWAVQPAVACGLIAAIGMGVGADCCSTTSPSRLSNAAAGTASPTWPRS